MRLGAMEIRITHRHPREGTSSIPKRTMSREPTIQKTWSTGRRLAHRARELDLEPDLDQSQIQIQIQTWT